MPQKIENNIVWISLAVVLIVALVCWIRSASEELITPVKATYTPRNELIRMNEE